MTNGFLVARILGFAAGTALFALLSALSMKTEKQIGGARAGLAAALLGVVWNLGNLAKYLALICGHGISTTPYNLAEAFAQSATALLPTALLLLQLSRWTRPEYKLAGKRLSYLSYAGAGLLTAAFFAANLINGFPLSLATLKQFAAYTLFLHVIAGLILFRIAGQPMRPVRLYSRAMLIMMAVVALSSLVVYHLFPGTFLMPVLQLLIEQSSLPMAIATFIFLTKYRFADRFVKKSLAVLAAAIISLFFTFFFVEPLIRKAQVTENYVGDGFWIATTSVLSMLLFSFPALEKAIGSAADRWLFRRPDYRGLAQQFLNESERAENELELLQMAAQKIRTALDAAAVQVIDRDRVAEYKIAGEKIPNDIILLRHNHPARKLLDDLEVEMLVPIHEKGQIKYFLAVAPGASSRKLLSDEIEFLLMVAERIGRRLESLQFDYERRERERREARLQQLLTESKLKALRAQVNPHFLFNTLNTIADLIGSEPEKAEDMTEQLAEVFRYLLAGTDQNLITVNEEFDFLHTYLEIERVRFGTRLQIELVVDPSIVSEPIPPLILQPLVENAIKHGLSKRPGRVRLRVSAFVEGGFLRLVVEDNGSGIKEPGEKLQQFFNGRSIAVKRSKVRGGIGLENVAERLRTLYGEQASLSLSSESGHGTCVNILIPRNETQNADNR